MTTGPLPAIEPLAAARFDEFVPWLARHLAGNGVDGHPHFQPRPRGTPPDERRACAPACAGWT